MPRFIHAAANSGLEQFDEHSYLPQWIFPGSSTLPQTLEQNSINTVIPLSGWFPGSSTLPQTLGWNNSMNTVISLSGYFQVHPRCRKLWAGTIRWTQLSPSVDISRFIHAATDFGTEFNKYSYSTQWMISRFIHTATDFGTGEFNKYSYSTQWIFPGLSTLPQISEQENSINTVIPFGGWFPGSSMWPQTLGWKNSMNTVILLSG